jgi:two-component system chemotaxis response regulator CheY
MRVLIVDDDFYCRSMIHEILHPYAYCDMAVNGEEAVEAFRRAVADGRPYDLVCLDLVMPDMDGQQTLREIRAMERETDRKAPLETRIIVTSMLEDRQETHDAFFLGGATAYLVKPITEGKLLAELRNLGFSIRNKD